MATAKSKMEESPTDVKKKSKTFTSKRWVSVPVGLLLLTGLGFAGFMVFRSDSATEFSSSSLNQSDMIKEVDVVTLSGFHFGRMIVRGNNTEGPRQAEIDYKLECRDQFQLNKTMLHCVFTQIGCTTLMQDNGTEEECIMEDISLEFQVDEDGAILTNDTDNLDPARLAMALYSKHLAVRDNHGELQHAAINKTNSTHASIVISGMHLEVTELPANALRNHQKRSKKSKLSRDVLQMYSRQDHADRNRRAVSSYPSLKGAFGNSLKNSFKGGPFVKVPQVFSESGSHWGIRYHLRLSDLEVLLSTLPDIRVTGIVPPLTSVSQDGYKVKVLVDFSLKEKCSDVVSSRVRVYFRARLCIWFWCLVNVKKDDRVSIPVTPKMELTLSLKPRGAALQHSIALTHLDMAGSNTDLGSIDINFNLGVTIGTVLFGPAGFLVGFLVDRITEHIAYRAFDNLKRDAPGRINSVATSILKNYLPPPGVLNGAGAALVAAHMASGLYKGDSVKLLTLELSKIDGLLANAPPPFQPNRISCSGHGLIETIHDGCMHDFGASASGDNLEIYCFNGAKRFCLSGELCPWRNQRSPACSAMFELATCSVGGLSGTNMADAWGADYRCHRRCRRYWFWRRCWNECRCSGSSYRNIDCKAGSVVAY